MILTEDIELDDEIDIDDIKISLILNEISIKNKKIMFKYKVGDSAYKDCIYNFNEMQNGDYVEFKDVEKDTFIVLEYNDRVEKRLLNNLIKVMRGRFLSFKEYVEHVD